MATKQFITALLDNLTDPVKQTDSLAEAIQAAARLQNVDDTSDSQKVASGPIADALSFKGPSYFSRDVALTKNLTAYDMVSVRRWSDTTNLCPAIYGKVASEPSHDLKFQDAAGNWWENQEPVINVLMAGADPSGSIVDVTADIRRAVSPNRPVFFPVGTYDVTDIITLNSGQKIFGTGRTRSVINVTSDFNLSALGVFRFPTGDSNCQILDLGIVFNQPTPFVGMTRADLIHYPPAIYAVDSARWIVDRVRISSAWDGINASGNAGGVDVGTLEIGAFNIGLEFDGALDFVKISTYRFWGYGIGAGGTPDGDLFRDGTTVSMEIGRVDSFNIGMAAILRGNIVITSSADSGLPIVFNELSLDSNPQLDVAGGVVFVNSGYSTGDSSALLSPIKVSAGYLEMMNFSLVYAGAHLSVDQSGGRFKWRGGRLLHTSDAFAAIDSTAGGRLTLDGVELLPATNRTTPYIKAGPFSQITGIVAADAPSGGYKKLIQIATDNANVNIQDNQLNGWELDIVANAKLGIYGPNGKSEDWTPTLTFATLGDAVFTYTTRLGKIYRDSTGYRFEARIEFSTNAYTTASGAFAVKGLPALGAGISGVPVVVGGESLIDLPAGYTQVSSTYSTSTSIDANGHIAFNANGDNASLVSLTTTHIKPSVSGMTLFLSGYVATR